MNFLNKKSLCFLSVALLSACAEEGADSLHSKADLSGSVVKGPIDGASLSLWPINPSSGFVNRRQEPLANSTSDAEGNFFFFIEGLEGPGLLESSGGVFIDESDANFDGGDRRSVTLTEGQGLSVYIPAEVSLVSLTIVTEAMTRRAYRLAEAPNVTMDAAFDGVRNLTIQALGYDPVITEAVNPLNPGSGISAAQKQYALTIGGLAYAAHEVAIRSGLSQMTSDAINAVITDFSDGRMDGKEEDLEILVNNEPMADVDLALAISRFRSNNDSKYKGITAIAPNEELLSGEPTVESTENTAPRAQPDNVTTETNQFIDVLVLDNDTDFEGDSLTIIDVTPAQAGTTEINGNAIRYTPAADFSGEDQFSYVVDDGRGGVSDSFVSVTVGSTNSPPVAEFDSASTLENELVEIYVLMNDFDPDGDPLFIVDITQPANGVTSISSNFVTYFPNEGFTGEDQFNYTIDDGRGGVASATVAVFVEPSGQGGQGGGGCPPEEPECP